MVTIDRKVQTLADLIKLSNTTLKINGKYIIDKTTGVKFTTLEQIKRQSINQRAMRLTLLEE